MRSLNESLDAKMKITNIVKYTSDKLYVYVQIINNETLLFPFGSYT